ALQREPSWIYLQPYAETMSGAACRGSGGICVGVERHSSLRLRFNVLTHLTQTYPSLRHTDIYTVFKTSS
ncbi:hypothetical protein ACI6Q5_17750, partial [Xanthomonas codiaei]